MNTITKGMELLTIEVTKEHKGNRNSYTYENRYKVKGDLDIYISVPSKLVAGDSVYNTYEKFLKANSILYTEIGILIGSSVGIIVMLFILKKFKYKPCYSKKIEEKLKDIPLEFKLLGLLMGYIAYKISFVYSWNNEYRYTINIQNIILVTLILVAYYVIIRSLLQNYKEGTLLKDSYGIKLYGHLCIAIEKGTIRKKINFSYRSIRSYLY